MKKLSAAFLLILLTGAALFAGCVNAPIGRPVGGDWRTMRGYTRDYVLSDTLTVTFSCFEGKGELEGCHCYAMYDASCGARMATLEVDAENSKKMTATSGENFLTEDVNGDGVKDIGVPVSDGTLWYSVVPNEYPEEGYPVCERISPEA